MTQKDAFQINKDDILHKIFTNKRCSKNQDKYSVICKISLKSYLLDVYAQIYP